MGSHETYFSLFISTLPSLYAFSSANQKTKGPVLSSLKQGGSDFLFDSFDFFKNLFLSSRVGQKREDQNFYLIHLIF